MVWLTSSYNHKGKSKVQTEHKTQINTSPRNKTKTKGNPITNHQLTTAILFPLSLPQFPHSFSFYIFLIPTSFSLISWSSSFVRLSQHNYNNYNSSLSFSTLTTQEDGFYLTGPSSHHCHASLHHPALCCFLQAFISNSPL